MLWVSVWGGAGGGAGRDGCVCKQVRTIQEERWFYISLTWEFWFPQLTVPLGRFSFSDVPRHRRGNREWRRQRPVAWILRPQCLPSGIWPGVWLLFIPAEVLFVFELALPAYMLEPQAAHEVCPRALKPMSWRLGRENVSLSFWVNSMFFPRG